MDLKKENFKRISQSRVNKILTTIEQLENLTNTSFYEYSQEDIEKLFSLIEKQLRKTKKILNENNKKGKKTDL